VPQLLPSSIFFYDISWIRPGGRLVLGIFMLTVGLFWVMLLMKSSAAKSFKTGAAIFVLGVGAGSSMVIVGKIAEKNQLIRDTLVPNGFIIAWIAGICGLWVLIMSINASQLKLPISKLQHVLATIVLMAVFYVVGGFVHPVSILMDWFSIITLLISIKTYGHCQKELKMPLGLKQLLELWEVLHSWYLYTQSSPMNGLRLQQVI
jgi:hypothetical protein